MPSVHLDPPSPSHRTPLRGIIRQTSAVHLTITYGDGRQLHLVQWARRGEYRLGQTGVGLIGMPGFPWRVQAIYDEPRVVLMTTQQTERQTEKHRVRRRTGRN